MKKAWFLSYDGSTFVTDEPENIYWECVDTEDPTQPLLFLLSEITNMGYNDTIERGEYKVTCRMVDDEYLKSLPEFDGW